MKTHVIKIDKEKNLSGQLRSIVSILKKDGLIVYPTETFYGLGANCFSPEAVKRIFVLKRRDKAKPLPVVISDRIMLKMVVAAIPSVAEPFLDLFWPGPLTLIFPAAPFLPRDLLGAAKSIGVRLPAHPVLRDLVKMAGFPITATSANLSGEEELSDPDKVLNIFAGQVDCIVDGGKTKGGLPSTVIDLTSPKPQILREGAIPLTELQKGYKDISIPS
ncbi:MAG: L-threonylcarbamoyladenylate synthase [Candidatus Aminicenantes bacterium]|jgi:L-threonylcarbamoyladenylate synthase